MQLNIVDTFMQRTESLSLSPLIMWPDQCILAWRERRGLMMKKRVHKAHPLQIQMSLGLKLCFHRTELGLWQTQYEEAMELNLFHFSFVAPV